ncbi:MAG TPA: hypothetical protein VI653_30360 [Steroidobacteraceae bacterium]
MLTLKNLSPPMPLASALRARNMPEPRPRRAHGLVLMIASCAFGATLIAGCASTGSSGRLVATTPQGVDLSGEWRLNVNLSDDPGRINEPKESMPPAAAPERNPGGFGKPGITMPGGPGGIDPSGDLTKTAASASGLVPVLFQSGDLPASSSDSDPSKPPVKSTGGEGSVSHMLNAPELLQISQSGTKLIVKSMADGSADEYTAGEQRTIPFGQTEADRSAGWRDSAFVVITKAHKGPSKEDDFALDSEGHLIYATLVTHVKKGPIDFKRVYDRVRSPK